MTQVRYLRSAVAYRLSASFRHSNGLNDQLTRSVVLQLAFLLEPSFVYHLDNRVDEKTPYQKATEDRDQKALEPFPEELPADFNLAL